MEQVFKQIKHSVVTAISNDPLKNYKLDESSVIKAGRNNFFLVYPAIDRTNNKEVSVFTVPLKELSARCGSSAETSQVIEQIKKSVALLSQLHHPNILQMEHPLVEEKKKMWFVTERISSFLPLVNMADIPMQVRLLQLRHCAAALQFIHEKADILVVNFNPNSLCVMNDGQWKICDLVHAAIRTIALAQPPLPIVATTWCTRSLATPLLDYMAYEYINSLLRLIKNNSSTHRSNSTSDSSNTVAGMDSLFGKSESNSPLVFPDSDVFAFILVTVEVLTERRLFNCVGQPEQQLKQRSDVERTVSTFFPPNALHLPRPPISTVASSGPFATPEIQLLISLETYDVMDASEKFRALQGIYNGLGSSAFCETIIIHNILPLMKRESENQSMLKYTVPVMLQCCVALSEATFDAQVKPFFVSLINAMVKAPSMEKTELIAQQILEKMNVFEKHFTSVADQNAILMPFLVKCIDCSGNNGVLRMALETLHTLLERNRKVGGILLPSHLADSLIKLGSNPNNLLASAFECLELVLDASSLVAKEAAEITLLKALNLLVADDSTATQARLTMKLLHGMERHLSLEHLANKTIPALSPLLLNRSMEIRNYAVRSIEDILKKFDPVALCSAPVGLFDEVSGVKNTSMPFTTHNTLINSNNSTTTTNSNAITNSNNNISVNSGVTSSSNVITNNSNNMTQNTNTIMHPLWSAESKLTTPTPTVAQNAHVKKSNELTLSDLLSTK